jgi:DNA-directed RNA polymerase subunit omega
MLHPSYTDLINAVNSGVEPGEQPVVQSRYSIVIAAAKRARQIVDGSEPLVAGAAGKKALSTAVQELFEQKVSIMAEEEVEETPAETAVEEVVEAASEAETIED